MRRLAWAVALALGLGGCSPIDFSLPWAAEGRVQVLPVVLCPGPPELAQAAERWNSDLDSEAFTFLGDCTVRVEVVEVDLPEAHALTHLDPGGERGLDPHAEVELLAGWSRATEEQRIALLRHELGHVLGLGHREEGCVMGIPSGYESCPAEIELLRKHYPEL